MTTERNYDLLETEGGVPIKAWIRGVPMEDEARRQLENVARLPFVHRWVAAMPDVHYGIGATVGSVVATRGAIVPAAVGVDIGCGMMAVQTSLRAADLPDDLGPMRAAIEKAVPHGRTAGRRDPGAWHDPPAPAAEAWKELGPAFERIARKHPKVKDANTVVHLGTLGTGNHFIEVCLDESDTLWFLLHSGSRGVGNRIGSYFIELAKKDLGHRLGNLPDEDLAYFEEGAEHFADYVEAVDWAQRFAMKNRELMMAAVVRAAASVHGIPPFDAQLVAVNCHHNYVARERHYGADVFVTRKGAVRAGLGELGIIPGSMGAASYIVLGKGHPEAFESCSHGAGRAMSRTKARQVFTLADHRAATAHVECRKDEKVLDETPGAYKPIDKVMEAQRDLVEVVHTLRQVVCVKG
ncbi:MAG TPA: RtcB family protein [Planctomycetota bacterium]|jgi:tRNA-splicing ligase RtcB|nr:RtcB family protein [Planctomycetota bacterium]